MASSYHEFWLVSCSEAWRSLAEPFCTLVNIFPCSHTDLISDKTPPHLHIRILARSPCFLSVSKVKLQLWKWHCSFSWHFSLNSQSYKDTFTEISEEAHLHVIGRLTRKMSATIEKCELEVQSVPSQPLVRKILINIFSFRKGNLET